LADRGESGGDALLPSREPNKRQKRGRGRPFAGRERIQTEEKKMTENCAFPDENEGTDSESRRDPARWAED